MQRERIVYIIDDEPEMCRSIELLLAIERFQTRSFPSAEAFVEQVSHLPVGIILSDIAMKDMSGLDLLKALPSLDRTDPVILITGHGDIALAVTAIKSGAADFIEKPFEAVRLLQSVKAVHDVVTRLSVRAQCMASLSRRERQVLKHIVRGLTAKQTAIELEISPRTVETYRQHLMEKTGASSLSQLVRFGMEAHVD
ncbi:response regulator transcription factor [Sphingomonas sp. Leaf38]|jgi:two-component system response regulator FixJ|uniref:response regulator transcription factor n=1 Tax=Sphingomonas sp. Leaf38 TaxID=1736217 RepID=UPI000A578A2A|nr:response regulator [Sphingomonas sp. Leaf38]